MSGFSRPGCHPHEHPGRNAEPQPEGWEVEEHQGWLRTGMPFGAGAGGQVNIRLIEWPSAISLQTVVDRTTASRWEMEGHSLKNVPGPRGKT